MKSRLADLLTDTQRTILGETLAAALEEGVRTLELHKADNPESETGSLSDDAEVYLRLIRTQQERMNALQEIYNMLEGV